MADHNATIKNNLAVLFVLGLVTLGCREEKSVGIGYPALVGTWRLVQRTVSTDTTMRIDKIPATPTQTITFQNDGSFSSEGPETSYYRSAEAYKTDTTFGQQKIGFLPGNIYNAFYQDFTLRADSLTLLPCAAHACDLVFIKGR